MGFWEIPTFMVSYESVRAGLTLKATGKEGGLAKDKEERPREARRTHWEKGRGGGEGKPVSVSSWAWRSSLSPTPLLAAVVQSLSRVRHPETPGAATHQAPLSSTISWSFLKFRSIKLVMLANHLILCCPILLLPSISPSIRVFSSELALYIRRLPWWLRG